MDEKNLKKINEMNNEELNNALYDKMRAEQDKFRAWLESQTVSEILHHTYEYVTKEDILMALDDNPLPTAQARALLQSSSPLEDIYKDWTKKETDYMQDILDTIAERANIFCSRSRRNLCSLPMCLYITRPMNVRRIAGILTCLGNLIRPMWLAARLLRKLYIIIISAIRWIALGQ